MKKTRIAIYGFLTVFMLASAFVISRSLVAGPTVADFDQLEIGMTKWQVRRTLGLWPDKSYVLLKGQVHEDWYGNGGMIVVAFDDQNQLIWKTWVEGVSRPLLGERLGLYKIRE